MKQAAWAVIGLGFGDEGKGSVVDFLVRETGARLVARWNGGPQAAHHVVTAEGVTHCFSQFGSGSLVPETETVLCREMLVDPLALAREAAALKSAGVPEPLETLTVDPRCRLVLPHHKLINQMRELVRGEARHGSCGRGVGEAVRDSEHLGPAAVTMADVRDRRLLGKKLDFLWRLKVDLAEQIAAEAPGVPHVEERLHTLTRLDLESLADDVCALAVSSGLRIETDRKRLGEERRRGGAVVFEGAHGVLLDSRSGFYPHLTKTRTTFRGLERLLDGRPRRIGVLRAYATRHGAGPFVTEDPGLSALLPEAHNVANDWQGPMRAGWLDLVALRYAIRVTGGVDVLAVTNLDRLCGLSPVRVAIAYDVPRAASAFFDSEGLSPQRARSMKVPRQTDPARMLGRTRLLSDCRPVYREFPGWEGPLPPAGRIEELPASARTFLSFLGSEEGLGVPVALVSAGQTAQQKVVLTRGILDAVV